VCPEAQVEEGVMRVEVMGLLAFEERGRGRGEGKGKGSERGKGNEGRRR